MKVFNCYAHLRYCAEKVCEKQSNHTIFNMFYQIEVGILAKLLSHSFSIVIFQYFDEWVLGSSNTQYWLDQIVWEKKIVKAWPSLDLLKWWFTQEVILGHHFQTKILICVLQNKEVQTCLEWHDSEYTIFSFKWSHFSSLLCQKSNNRTDTVAAWLLLG